MMVSQAPSCNGPQQDVADRLKKSLNARGRYGNNIIWVQNGYLFQTSEHKRAVLLTSCSSFVGMGMPFAPSPSSLISSYPVAVPIWILPIITPVHQLGLLSRELPL
jgi:hypothetical protein